MNEKTELDRVRHVLSLVRREVEKWDPNLDLALEYLRSVKDSVDRYPGTRESAQYSLALAEVFTATHSQAAMSFLREAEEKIARLSESAPDLEVRLHDRLGYCCETVLRNRTLALKHLELAKAAAVMLGVREYTAHQQLRLIRLELKVNDNPERENFMALGRTARTHGYTEEERLASWHLHCGETYRDQTSASYARGMQKRSEDYFLGLLRSVRVHQ